MGAAVVSILAAAASAFFFTGVGARPTTLLDKVEARVRNQFADVAHITAEDLKDAQDRGDDVVVVDVREAGEYRVSRIKGAVLVSPEISAKDLAAKLGPLAGKTVVLYCSVGVRSSNLARRASQTLKMAGAEKVYNLSGGIFRWHGEALPLVDSKGPHSAVHPYNTWWSRYVTRKDEIRYSARKS